MMTYNFRLLAHVACGCAALSLSLLTIGFATPGWLVVRVTPKDTLIWNLSHKDREVTVYLSVWFARVCTNGVCKVTSVQGGMERSAEQNRKHLSNGLNWNIEIHVESIITLFCGLVGFVLLVIFNRTKVTKKGLGIAGLFCHLVSANLVTVLILKMAAINGQMELYKDDELNFELWTPYSIAIIGAGGLMAYCTALSCIVMVCVQQSYKHERTVEVEEGDSQDRVRQPNGHCIHSNLNGYSVILQDIPMCNRPAVLQESSTMDSFS